MLEDITFLNKIDVHHCLEEAEVIVASLSSVYAV